MGTVGTFSRASAFKCARPFEFLLYLMLPPDTVDAYQLFVSAAILSVCPVLRLELLMPTFLTSFALIP